MVLGPTPAGAQTQTAVHTMVDAAATARASLMWQTVYTARAVANPLRWKMCRGLRGLTRIRRYSMRACHKNLSLACAQTQTKMGFATTLPACVSILPKEPERAAVRVLMTVMALTNASTVRLHALLA